MKQIILNNWTVTSGDISVPAHVPGDIHIDLFKQGLIADPYIGENYQASEWVGRRDWVYETRFIVNEEELQSEDALLEFKGIDLFADISLNGKTIGSVKNAFLAHTYSIKDLLKEGENVLRVEMKSTLNAMDEMDGTGYFSIFNDKRIFVRKPQCHFGWDWAPKICAYGIIDDVVLSFCSKHRIDDVRVVTDIKGNVVFHLEVNYNPKALLGPDHMVVKAGEPMDGDTLVVKIAKEPGSKEFVSYDIPLTGQKNFCAAKLENPKLWWPVGYGEQPLYDYEVDLLRGGKVCDNKKGRFAFREVKILEEPKEKDLLGMSFEINGKEIFLKGSNWVPPECFTGTMTKPRYRALIELALKANMNLLRVWGGGSYEIDYFYDLCDELGIMVWQDFALACADIPEDKPDFMENFLEEAEYQVKRLRNHPSLIFWCGGNEKTGTYGNLISKGDYLVNYVLAGLVNHLDGTRPYRRQSPHSYTDIGNDKTSGDSHHGSLELCLETGLDAYRKNVASQVVPFISECALLGPSSLETMKKFIPEDKLWPMNEVWNDRLMENPYAAIVMDFPHRELFYAESLYGKVTSLEDFIPKGMSAHAEAFRVECEFARAHSDKCGSFINWMYDDIWPSGTWATVDYYEEPKQVYYQARKSFAPLLVSFYEDKDGITHLFVDNEAKDDFSEAVTYGVKDLDGRVLEEQKIKIKCPSGSLFDLPLCDFRGQKDIYLYVKYGENKTLYSPTMWKGEYEVADIAFSTRHITDNRVEVIVTSEIFAKSVFAHLPDNYRYFYSDNYVDLEPGDKVSIFIESEHAIDLDAIRVEGLVRK